MNMISIQPHESEKIRHNVDKNFLIKKFQTFLPVTSILCEKEELTPYECDGLAAYRCCPWIVVLPETTEQIQKILKCCNELNVPVVARGAGTGLSGGALPLDNGVLIVMAKFNNILNIDLPNRLAVVQPGVRNIAITQAVSEYGFYYAPDPSSQIACSIGGNVAENSGGVHCLKYGMTTHNILRLKIVTIEGELVTIGSHALDSPGYDLLAVLCGSEGMLGVIVEISVKLLPKPEQTQVVLAAFDSVQLAGHAVAEVIASGFVPAGLEMMDRAAIHAAEAYVQVGYPLDVEAILICEIDGTEEQVNKDVVSILKLFQSCGAKQLKTATNEYDRQKIWAGRKAAFPAVGRISPDYYCMDGTIPRRFLADMLEKIDLLAVKFGLTVANVFHAGDGNLHPLILYNADIPGDLEKAERLGGEILELSIQFGGAITGEHGVGVEKINHMCLQFSHEEIDQMHALKKAFDQKCLLNPGKAVPSFQRCAEFGAMHVHKGQLKHPELERF